jgi:hypothetical protein
MSVIANVAQRSVAISSLPSLWSAKHTNFELLTECKPVIVKPR